MTDQELNAKIARIDALMGKVTPGTPEEAEYLALLAETTAEEDRREAGWPDVCAKSGMWPWCDGAIPAGVLWLSLKDENCAFGRRWQLPWVGAALPRVTRLWERQRVGCAWTGVGEVCDAG